MASMKAVRIHAYGGTEQLIYEDAPRPTPGDGDVLVRVVATAVSPFDAAARAGYLAGWYSYTFPLILGLDVAGVVEEVGAGVADFAPGDAVYGRTDPGRVCRVCHPGHYRRRTQGIVPSHCQVYSGYAMRSLPATRCSAIVLHSYYR